MDLRNRAFRNLGAAAVVCALAAACTQPGPQAPRVSPTPSPVDTTPTETQLERQTRLDFEAAEKSYRENWNEVLRLGKTGGTDSPTKILKETSVGDYLILQMESLEQLKRSGQYVARGGVIRNVSHGNFKEASLTITACEDYRQAVTKDQEGSVVQPVNTGTRIYVQNIIVKSTGQSWKLSDLTTDQVDSCPN